MISGVRTIFSEFQNLLSLHKKTTFWRSYLQGSRQEIKAVPVVRMAKNFKVYPCTLNGSIQK